MEHFPQNHSIVPLLHCSKANALCAFALVRRSHRSAQGSVAKISNTGETLKGELGRKGAIRRRGPYGLDRRVIQDGRPGAFGDLDLGQTSFRGDAKDQDEVSSETSLSRVQRNLPMSLDPMLDVGKVGGKLRTLGLQ